MLKNFGMENAKEISTLMSSTCKLDKDENDKSLNEKLYKDMIDSLLYLTASRSDILLNVCMCARFQI